MKSLSAITLAAGLMFSLGAAAGPVTVTFEGLANNTAVGNYYNGGAGTNYGISFGAGATALVASVAGTVAGQPAPGDTVMTWTPGGSTTATLAAGWTGSFSFYYAGVADLTVSLLDAAGTTIVGSGLLPGVGNSGCTGNVVLCNWNQYTIDFAGTATAVSFTGLAGDIAVDNLTFGSTGGGGNVPEPGSLALAGLALGLLGAVARRKSV
ncbi:MAG: PEP-CTERM sorting domain-containing protein [Burkholderiales bacterium]|nr:PEP-CTERM sorting domain-containing protein [Burkholderiales bacterium]MDE1926655.1 PEP-CTERM sorting domain-containing protein [Burkholderiales bacterium]MDE2159427.1 PEP-CTERM sorting domain-containing protein [Burkholderiales bacterium]MDE2503785.1 PEP-CTERM sorting domain-containing protein [Burkholderiales bacterium]